MNPTQFVADLNLVLNDLLQLHSDHHLWSQLNDQLRYEPWIGEPGDVMQFIANSHFAALGIGLRRQAELDADSISLARLIHHVAARHILFRRSDYVARYATGSSPSFATTERVRGDEDFTRLAADPNTPIYPPARAYRHLEWLRRRIDPLRRFVNRAIAHRSRAKPTPITVGEHQRLLMVMFKLWRHYNMLATGSWTNIDLDDLLSPGWYSPLERPWKLADAHLGLCSFTGGNRRADMRWLTYPTESRQ